MGEFWAYLAELPDSGGMVLDGRRWSTPQLRDLALRASADLARRGVDPGDMVACLLPNSVEFVALWWACAHRGATFHPVNTGLRGETLSYLLSAAEPTLVVASDDLTDTVRGAVPPGVPVAAAGRWWDRLPAPSRDSPAVPGSGGQVIFTSGTTGRPKGVCWPAVTQCGHARAYAEELIVLTAATYACLPLFHVTAQGTTMATLAHGGTIHLDRTFPVRTFWQRLAETGAMAFPFVGSILSVLLKDDRPAPPHRVRVALGAAAPVAAWAQLADRYGVALVETYGQTEMAGTWLHNLDGRPGAVGDPCARIQARLVAVDGAPDGAGELQVRPLVEGCFMSGYLDPADTAAAHTDDGWYRTRDLLALRADGYYRFVGRTSDAIRRRGENISAWEVEQAFGAHPGIGEVAAIGVPSEVGEEDVALYFVPRAGETVTVAELRRWAAERLGAFMRPRHYVAMPALPKTQTQRVQKAALRADFAGR